MNLFDRILAARGLDGQAIQSFLSPVYESLHDPFLLPDMKKAVDRLIQAKDNQEKVTIYGDYDIDGLTATALMIESLKQFGFKNVDHVIPSRFADGYGLSIDSVEKIAADGTKLILTVDCGSLSEKEIIRAKDLGVDVIVTDHHTVADKQPPAVAVINPKRPDNKYPFIDLAGVGVAFRLVQAMQQKIFAFDDGQEKWLLDLVALGTVCDIVSLTDENRTYVYWGLKVLSQTRRQGLKALMAVSGVDPKLVNTRSLGFGLGPRMNAAGRLETAQKSLDLLLASDPMEALQKAQYLDMLNLERRNDQTKIFKEACLQADKYRKDPVLVLSGNGWNHGIVGIVASKILEKYKKPVFVLEEIGNIAKGSARSYGDFSVVEAINENMKLLNAGGGHKLAAGISIATSNIDEFRQKINEFYNRQQFSNQLQLLLPKEDATAELNELTEELVNQIDQLEPFGNGNPRPTLKSDSLLVKNVRSMGSDGQHVKLELADKSGHKIDMLAFNAPEFFKVEVGKSINVWYHINVNEWQGRRSVEGQLLHIEIN